MGRRSPRRSSRRLLELVERDAVMLAWKCRLSLPLLDWSDDDGSRALDTRFFARPGLRFAVVDASCFLDVPVAIAVVHGRPASRAALAVGAGAAADVGGGVAQGGRRGIRRLPLARKAGGVGRDRPLPDPTQIESFDDHMLLLRARTSRPRSPRSSTPPRTDVDGGGRAARGRRRRAPSSKRSCRGSPTRRPDRLRDRRDLA